MITKTLKEEAKKEAVKLRENATKEELNRLNFDDLAPSDPSLCIYGLMTGNCYSNRASDLLNLCAIPYANSHSSIYRKSDLTQGIKSKGVPDNYEFDRHRNYFSPIETLIIQRDKPINANLIAYLRGETDEFNF